MPPINKSAANALVKTEQDRIVQQAAGRLPSTELAGYAEWIAEIKQRVRLTQIRSARAINSEVLRLYWSIGHDILHRQASSGWGSKILERISQDLRAEFPGQSGFSRTNLHYMQKVAQTWPTWNEFVQRHVEQLPWGYITVLIDKLATRDERDWYAARAVSEGWSRNLLEHFIKVGLREQLGAAPTNFAQSLGEADSELAQQLVKDPYVFEHLAFVDRIDERTVEQALIDRLQDTLTEFGNGMAFVGRQVHLRVVDEHGDVDEFIPDLILYHIPQSRYVVVELKVGKFKPEYLGQLGTYVAIIDDQLRDKGKQAPTIGMLLCTSKNEATVRYSLANMSSAVGVADYAGLPADAQAALPSVEDLQTMIAEEFNSRENREK